MSVRRPARRLLAGVAVVLALALGAAAPASAAALPGPYSFAAGLAANVVAPFSSPPGSNIWSCRPSAAHPRPVVLVHGTFANMTNSWQALSPLLKNKGYCVYALDYGDNGLDLSPIKAFGDIPASAAELAAFVDRVRASTGAAQVDIVGHSQGGMMPRYYLKYLGGGPKVHTLVGLVPSNHGTNLFGLLTLAQAFPGGSAVLGAACASCVQQTAGSGSSAS